MTNRWNGDIIPGSMYGDPRAQASRSRLEDQARNWSQQNPGTVHGLTANQAEALNQRFSEMMPRLATSNGTNSRRDIFSDSLPPGASWDPRRTAQSFPGASGVPGLNSSAGGGRNLYTTQRPYQPEFESPDRQQYPVHRILANRYWRLFAKMDPVIGTGGDMYAEMPWSDVKLTGKGVEGEIREVYESMWEACSVLSLLPAMVREFLIIGEVCPHCFYDEAEGMWTYIALHNPDNLEVIDAPFIKMEPIVEFVPDDQLRAILTSSDPELQKVRQNLPSELIAKLYARQNIRINTETNATFIARKLHPYETRGTSILSRMWRVLMYEDAIFNASIATARRHAGPLKIAKLGNPQTNWIPGPEHERRFAELVSQAEMDPHAWIIYHYGLSLEAFGTTDRVMTINREWEVIERIKLAALGISRNFMSGELTFASATASLQVFLRRLQTLRSFIEQVWLRPKFFKVVAEINGFYQSSTAERSHGIRVRRSAQEIRESKRLIIPTLDWANKLNPNVDKDLLSAIGELEQRMGVRISKTKKMAVVNLSFEDELTKSIEEDKFENELREKYGLKDEKGDPKEIKEIEDKTDETRQRDQQETQAPPDQLKPPPNPRLGPKQEPPKQTKQEDLHPVQLSSAEQAQPKQPWPNNQLYGWEQQDVEDLIDLLKTGDTESAKWSLLKPQKTFKTKIESDGTERRTPVLTGYDPYSSMRNNQPEEAWDQIESYLAEQGYPDNDIFALRRILLQEGVLPKTSLQQFEEQLPEDPTALSDQEFGTRYVDALRDVSPFGVNGSHITNSAKLLAQADAFLIGEGSYRDVHKRRNKVTSFHEAVLNGSHRSYDLNGSVSRIATPVKTPIFDKPENHESREHWQVRLQKSRITPDAKRYIKQIENEVVDGWQSSFEKLWKEVEHRLNTHQPIDSNVLSMMVSQNVKNQLKHINHDALDNAFTGLYSEGKDYAYKPTSFKDKKLEKLRKKEGSKVAFLKEAVTIDTSEDVRMLQEIKNTALEKVKSITDVDLRDRILQKLTEAGAENQNPIDLANAIIKEEAEKKKQKLKETIDEEARQILKTQLQSLYESQQYQLQRIMRTEAINGFVLSQLKGYQEQGIEKVQWNCIDDTKTCNLCRTLNSQQFDIETVLSEGGRYPLTYKSHPQCRCNYSPVLAYVTLDQFIDQYEKSHPEKFVQGEPLYDQSKLNVEDIIKSTLPTDVSTFEKVPVEHVELLKEVTQNIAGTPYEKHAPASVKFVKDVYDLDEYHSKEKPGENLSGQVSSWVDPDTDTTYVSSYASEFDPIDTVYLRDWASRVWEKEPNLHSEWKKLFKSSPERTISDELSKSTLEKLRVTFKPFPLAQSYFLESGDALGLSKKFREMNDTQAYALLEQLGVSSSDANTILLWKRQSPVWNLETGKAVSLDENEHPYINYEASQNPEAFFRESIVTYVTRPSVLESRDPALYQIVKGQIFDGKEFKK